MPLEIWSITITTYFKLLLYGLIIFLQRKETMNARRILARKKFLWITSYDIDDRITDWLKYGMIQTNTSIHTAVFICQTTLSQHSRHNGKFYVKYILPQRLIHIQNWREFIFSLYFIYVILKYISTSSMLT